MQNILCALVVLLSALVPALADPFDDLFAATQDGDMVTVKALLANAETQKLRRDMMWALAASHPETRAFTKEWAEAEPENPAALTARAWSLYREAFIVRGNASIRHSWPASLDAGSALFQEAYRIAQRAFELDLTYLPASDAVIVIGEVTGHGDESFEEGQRILTTSPNRHSLVLVAGQNPSWGGSISITISLCEEYAGSLPDAPGYTPEMCMIEAILKAQVDGEPRTWATELLPKHVSQPMLDETLIWAAERSLLAPEAADELRARLTPEDRLTVKVALSGRPHLLTQPSFPDMPNELDLPSLRAALDRDLERAVTAADRDPGNPSAIGDLAELYTITAQVELREAGYYDMPPPDDIEPKYFDVMDRAALRNADLKERALRLLKAASYNVEVLDIAASVLDDHLPDPLDAARWNLALRTNAMVYSNYRYDVVGGTLLPLKYGRSMLKDKVEAQGGRSYSEAELDATFDCAFIRNVRLYEMACKAIDFELGQCFTAAGLSLEDELESEDSVLMHAERRGACEAERTGFLEDLMLKEIDLSLD